MKFWLSADSSYLARLRSSAYPSISLFISSNFGTGALRFDKFPVLAVTTVPLLIPLLVGVGIPAVRFPLPEALGGLCITYAYIFDLFIFQN